VSSKQEQTLIALYKRMSSTEIRSRLAGSGLIPLARGVAENELHQRLERAAAGVPGSAEPDDATGTPSAGQPSTMVVAFRLLMMAVLFISILAGAALLFPKQAMFIVAVTVFVVAMAISKAFPLFGKIVGGLLLAAPMAICGLVVHGHRTNHWGTAEVLLICLAALVYSAISAAVGGVMYGAASEQE
jgi:hypothetical protein